MLIKRDQLAEGFRGVRRTSGEDDGVRRADCLSKTLCRNRRGGRSTGFDLGSCLAEGECLGLRKDVGHQHVVVASEGVEGFEEADEVAGNEPRSLVDELVEGVLAIGAGFAPVDGASGLVSTWSPVSVT